MSATARLPLFPLGTVLFPGVLLPLHVFEQRYRQLVRDLLAAPHEQRRFGVVAIREGREVGADGVRALHRVGCVARLRRVEPYDDGRFDIVTSGSQRFRITRLDQSLAYLQADVLLLDDPLGADDALAGPAAAQVGRAWAAYRETLGGTDADLEEGIDGDLTTLSYRVAAGMVLDLTERQGLLEAPHTADRLRRELALLRRETGLLSRLPSLPAVELTHLPASPN